jgi:hypothetical protein
MAGSGDSGSTWADVVKSLMDTFQLLRDIFGYALPGMVFAGIGVASGRIQLQHIENLFLPYHPPNWALAGLGVTACYIIGHLLASIAYLPIDLHKWWKCYVKKDYEWLEWHPTEICATDLKWRHFYPELFHDMDRRETMGLLGYSTLTAMLAGYAIFYLLQLSLPTTLLVISAFVFVDGLTLMQHLSRVRQAIHAAGDEIQKYEEAHAGSGDAKKVVAGALQAAIDEVNKPAVGK